MGQSNTFWFGRVECFRGWGEKKRLVHPGAEGRRRRAAGTSAKSWRAAKAGRQAGPWNEEPMNVQMWLACVTGRGP